MTENREQQMKDISERLEQGVKEVFTSEKFRDYLKTMAKFHDYSFNNTVLIAMQKPEATLVAGYHTWQKKFNRQVKRGEKGIQILAPMPVKEKREIEKTDPLTGEIMIGLDGEPEMEIVEMIIPRFRATTVFDISQTVGDPIPGLEVPELEGSVHFYEDFMAALKEVSPVPIQFMEIDGSAKGFYHQVDKYIAIREGMSESQTLKTAVHETIHALLHDREVMEEAGIEKGQTTKEVEAESVAFIVCDAFGLDTSEYSFPYIASWSSDLDMRELRTSMDTIRKTAAEVIDSLTEKMLDLQKDRSLVDSLEPERETEDLMREDNKMREDDFLNAPEDFYGIYQIDHEGEGGDRIFWGMDYLEAHNQRPERSHYQLIYTDRLTADDTLNSLYEKFNLNHPADFTGHSMSVSDIVVFHQNGENKAYFVDSVGFTELPDFLVQKENHLETENEKAQMPEAYPPVYRHTLEYAAEHGEADMYLDSRALNIQCKNAVEEAIKNNFDGMHLNRNVSVPVLEQYGAERVSFILANTVQTLVEDGRFSNGNKEWANKIDVPENISRGRNMNLDYLINSHPAVLDGFISEARHEIRMQDLERHLETAHITEYTEELSVEGHQGTWHSVDKRDYHGETFFLMRHNEYDTQVADVIVSEQGTLVAEDIWNGFDGTEVQAISEYLHEQGVTPYDLTELSERTVVTLVDGKVLSISDTQPIDSSTWEPVLAGKDINDTETWFSFYEIQKVVESDGIILQMPELHYIDKYYVLGDAQDQEIIHPQDYETLDEALKAYYGLPNHQNKVLGITNTAPNPESVEFVRCTNGIDRMVFDYRSESGWNNPQIAQAVKRIETALDLHDTEIAYRVGDKYFTIQNTEGGYDYTFYDQEYRELDGGVYDNPDVTIAEAINGILEDEDAVFDDCVVTDHAAFMELVEEAEYFPVSVQNALKNVLDADDDELAFAAGYGYITVQRVDEGFHYIIYDNAYREIDGDFYKWTNASMRDVVREIYFEERLGNMNCTPMEYSEIVKRVLERSKKELHSEMLRPTSEVGIKERALNYLSRQEIEETVLYHAQDLLEDMGLEEDVKLLGARVYGTRTREGLYRGDSDLDVVLSYRGSIREDSFFNALNEAGLSMKGLKLDINPISEENTGTLEEYVEQSEKYLNRKEIEKFAGELNQFLYDVDTYDYWDQFDNQEEGYRYVMDSLAKNDPETVKKILETTVEEDEVPETVEEAKRLLGRFDYIEDILPDMVLQKQEPEQEASISFYVAECMEFPVLGEYHQNLTLDEAIKIYEQIPSERMNGVKGIGFVLEDGSDYDGEFALVSCGRVEKDLIDMIQHYKESPLVQKAVADVEAYFSEKKMEQTTEKKEPTVQEEKPEPAKGTKASVLQALRNRQAKIKEEAQKKEQNKGQTKKRGEMEL